MPGVMTRTFDGHEFPYSEDLSILGKPVTIPGDDVTLKNAMIVQPLEGADSNEDGSPSDLTRRRYRRFFESGAAMVWGESLATTEDGRSYLHAPWIHESNLDDFKRFVDEFKSEFPDVVFIAQLTHAGRFSKPHDEPEPVIAMHNPHHNARIELPEEYPVVTDEYLDRISESFVTAARMCRQAGFDGVDVKGCHSYLFNELLSCRNRPGRYGGSFENRARMLLQTIEAIKADQGHGFIVATRICHADTIPYPYGFGMAEDGSLDYDTTELDLLVDGLHKAGANLVNVSVGRVTVNPAYSKLSRDEIPKDSTMDYFNRFYQGTAHLAHAFPDMAFVGSGYTHLRKDAPHVAAGALERGDATLIGFGRLAMSTPGFADAILAGGLDDLDVCTLCGNCYKLLRSGTPTGCPTHDRELYLPLLKKVLAR